MSNSLIELIDSRLINAASDVLVRAYEGIGECTYAAHMPGYLRALKLIEKKSGDWRCMPGRMAAMEEHRLTDDMEWHHREMYRQPCLICVVCQTRRKWWTHSAYTAFGEPKIQSRELRPIPMSFDTVAPYFV